MVMVITPNLSSPSRPITQLIFITTARNVAPLTRSRPVGRYKSQPVSRRLSGQPQPQQNSSHRIRIQFIQLYMNVHIIHNSIYTTPMGALTQETRRALPMRISLLRLRCDEKDMFSLCVCGFLPWSFSGRLRIYERCTFLYCTYIRHTSYMRNAWRECTNEICGFIKSSYFLQFLFVYIRI